MINFLGVGYVPEDSAIRVLKLAQLIPEGEQKTGCIVEFYAYLYLANKFHIMPIFSMVAIVRKDGI